MTESISLASASWRDFFGAWRIEQACFGVDAWTPPDVFIALLSARVCVKAHTPSGQMAGLVIGERHAGDNCGWIATLGVLPEFQRRGIGARLLAEAEARLQMPIVKLTVRQSNTGAIALYRRFGYVAQTVVERYYASGETGIVMEKQRG